MLVQIKHASNFVCHVFAVLLMLCRQVPLECSQGDILLLLMYGIHLRYFSYA